MKRLLAVSIALSLALASPAHAFNQSTKNPKLGQFCATKEAGLKVSGLVCKKSGTRYRWSR
jgi:hypothetical protein